MNSREHSELPPAPAYPSPNAAQIGQGTMQYYSDQRHLTAEELHLSAELSREASAANVNDANPNGIGRGQQHMVLASSNQGSTDASRPDPDESQQPDEQHLLQFTPSQQVGVDPNHDLSYGDQSARRKRSKVSRACDECRRKKVRCDATSESGLETCSNCRRTNSTCEFSRVPMKRGPSKGYIKELADRINSLESQIHPSVSAPEIQQYQQLNDDGSGRTYQDYSPGMEGNLLRKRTFSMSEGLSGAFAQPPLPQGQRPTSVGGWPVQTTNKESTQAPQDTNPNVDIYSSPLVTNGSTAKASQPFWAQEAPSAGQETGLGAVALDELDAAIEVDAKVLDAYYNYIHSILPILPNSRDRLRDHLRQASRVVQEIFLHSISTATGANPLRAEKEFQEIQTIDSAIDRIYASAREEASTRSLSTNFILLQSMILMMFDADIRGPENLRGQNGIPKSTLIDIAFPLGHYVAKTLGQLNTTTNPNDLDLDSDAHLARRIWIVIGILSRWHSLAVAGPDLFSLNETATPEDRHTFGLVALQLARYSTLLTEVNDLLFDSSPYALSNYGVSRALRRTLYGQLNRVRDVEALHLDGAGDGVSVAYIEQISPLMFWTITLLLKRHLFTYVPSEILYPAEVIIDLLQKHETDDSTNSVTSSPFHLHFLALAVITLLEITDIPDLASDAWRCLDKALQVIRERDKRSSTAGEFENIFSTQSWDACIHAAIESKLTRLRSSQHAEAGTVQQQQHQPASAGVAGASARQIVGPTEQRSLQHLADLAVGAGAGTGVISSSPPPTASATGTTADDKEGPAALAEGLAPSSNAEHHSTRVYVDFTRLTRKGYLNVFAGI